MAPRNSKSRERARSVWPALLAVLGATGAAWAVLWTPGGGGGGGVDDALVALCPWLQGSDGENGGNEAGLAAMVPPEGHWPMNPSREVKLEPLLPDDELLAINAEELAKRDGSGEDGALWLALGGIVFDVTESARLYAQHGPYHRFVGRDATRALALTSMDESDLVAGSDLTGFSSEQFKMLDDRVLFYRERYKVVGKLVHDDS